jgi:hypothetical protein
MQSAARRAGFVIERFDADRAKHLRIYRHIVAIGSAARIEL